MEEEKKVEKKPLEDDPQQIGEAVPIQIHEGIKAKKISPFVN
jgi:hypothetical protein